MIRERRGVRMVMGGKGFLHLHDDTLDITLLFVPCVYREYRIVSKDPESLEF